MPMGISHTNRMRCPNCKSKDYRADSVHQYACNQCGEKFSTQEGWNANKSHEEGSDPSGEGDNNEEAERTAEDAGGSGESPTSREIARDASYWTHTGDSSHD